MGASADLHVGDLDFRKILPVSRVPAVAGATREPENPNLLSLAMPHDLGRHRRTLDERRAVLHVLAVARHQDLVEGDFVPRLRIEQRDLDRDARLGAELAGGGGKVWGGKWGGNQKKLLGLVKPGHFCPSPPGPPGGAIILNSSSRIIGS